VVVLLKVRVVPLLVATKHAVPELTTEQVITAELTEEEPTYGATTVYVVALFSACTAVPTVRPAVLPA
jgi:hypothetical protein